MRIQLATITPDIIMAHIITISKANLEEIEGDLPQYESYEPGR